MRYALAGLALVFASFPAHANDLVFTGQYLSKSEYSGGYAWGLGAYGVANSGPSLYVNGMFSGHSDDDHYDDLDTQSFGDPIRDRKKDLGVFNVGGTFGLAESLALYAGLGYGWETGYAKKYDPTHILSDDGIYYVDDPSRDDSGLNGNAGVLLFLKNFTLEAGYHSFVEKAYFGAGWRF